MTKTDCRICEGHKTIYNPVENTEVKCSCQIEAINYDDDYAEVVYGQETEYLREYAEALNKDDNWGI